MSLDLNQPWPSYPVLSIDFESTGPDPLTCEPVEVACVRFEGGNVVARYSSLLRTEKPIPEEATKIHSITNEMVSTAPAFADIAIEIARLSEGAVPLAFNASYDRTVMHRYMTATDVTAFDPQQAWLCTFAMAWSADRFEPGAGRLKLAACCERRGIRIVGAHRAEADAIASGTLFHHLMTGTKPDVTMAKVLARVQTLSTDREKDYVAYKKKVREMEREIWRQYACAAMHAADSLRSTPETVASFADAMLKLERERFI